MKTQQQAELDLASKLRHGVSFKPFAYAGKSQVIEFVCDKHGDFSQRIDKALTTGGCQRCGVEKAHKSTTKDAAAVLEKIIVIHGDKYDYSAFKYSSMHTKVVIACKLHGPFTPTPSSLLKGCGCIECGKVSRGKTRTRKAVDRFVEQATTLHNSYYSYEKALYISSKEPIIITCPTHGDFTQLPSDHLGGHGCKQCATDLVLSKNLSNLSDFVDKATKAHGEYNYSRSLYSGSKVKTTITCLQHGDFEQTPNDHLSGYGCPVCGKLISTGEVEIADLLSIYTRVERRNRKIIAPKELDIYLPEYSVAIEFNGLYWHSEAMHHNAAKTHQEKHLLCKEKGIRLIQIWEDDWRNKQELVKAMLLNSIGQSIKIYARSCRVAPINSNQARRFFENNHLNGFRSSIHYIGLLHDDDLIMALSIGEMSVSVNSTGLEITRMAALAGHCVVGGLSKLLRYIDDNISYSVLTTFADALWYDGAGYEKAGFHRAGMTSPGYAYTFKHGGKRFHRYQFAKHKLARKLEHFDPALSEVSNMHNHGYVRLWDAGHYKFIKKAPQH